ncbi:formate dehydrogenase accessory sulfurtransferase FdhD [Lentisphaera profundi]|uniref:Sulfur carrier protein FdhD n=1 Tax=Lentisphaera profundi TaxID=1658616 RepID=A0ABY7VS11_9BACT|nr:formate dehydrogenase accessory sulfurtransferase FdhD [Lentisphaera profundi]WDE96089.1 formate dehydrogenase accessory sulfurtransferase FdhD [Lentisphaera profundi]
MEKIRSITSQKITQEGIEPTRDCLLVETPLQIIVNGEDLSLTMQTPGDERYLVRGLLHSEGISSLEFESFHLEEWQKGLIARVQLQEKVTPEGRRFGSSPSCGICGKRNVEGLFSSLKPLESQTIFNQNFVIQSFKASAKKQLLFSLTGGSHGVSAIDQNGKVLCHFEDVGRHNAVDKVIGYLLEHDCLEQAKMLTLSGRVSFEIIQKCCRAGIEVLAAISAPSSLAVEWAEKLNITLMAFCRDERFTVYSCPDRLESYQLNMQES